MGSSSGRCKACVKRPPEAKRGCREPWKYLGRLLASRASQERVGRVCRSLFLGGDRSGLEEHGVKKRGGGAASAGCCENTARVRPGRSRSTPRRGGLVPRGVRQEQTCTQGRVPARGGAVQRVELGCTPVAQQHLLHAGQERVLHRRRTHFLSSALQN